MRPTAVVRPSAGGRKTRPYATGVYFLGTALKTGEFYDFGLRRWSGGCRYARARRRLVRRPLRTAKDVDLLTNVYEVTLEEVNNDAVFEDDFQELAVLTTN